MWAACLGSALCSAGCTTSYEMSIPRVPLAPPGVFVDWDVARGYFSYRDVLASWGTWSGDDLYGVHWCPNSEVAGATFRPYRSHGHWTASSDPRYGAPPETPYWASDDGAWGEITMHHGWWIFMARSVPDSTAWCWVPGVRETPASVVWRSGGAFVGWAPEPPLWVDDGDDNADAGFDWTYEPLATLLEDVIDDFVLGGDDEAIAADATAPCRQVRGLAPPFARRAPARPVVVEARRRLVARLREAPSAALVAAKGPAPSASMPADGASRPGREPRTEARTMRADEEKLRLPPAIVLISALPVPGDSFEVPLDPHLVGSVAAPRSTASAPTGNRSPSSRASSSGGSTGTGTHVGMHGTRAPDSASSNSPAAHSSSASSTSTSQTSHSKR